jgi:hypothetical protein
MLKKAALLAAALAFALPATADDTSRLTHKNTQTLAPKNSAPSKNLNGPRSGSKNPDLNEHYDRTFGKVLVPNLSAKKVSTDNVLSVPGTKNPKKPKPRPRALQRYRAMPASEGTTVPIPK